MIYYTADLHFGHENVLKFDGRPFETIEEHDNFLIERWNETVRPEDQVYILGDFCMRAKKSPLEYLRKLNGRKYLIKGNHDSGLLKDPEVVKEFEWIEKMYFVKDGDYRIVLCHFPIAEWNKYNTGSWHIYGHIHNKRGRAFEYMRKEERALNAGIMINHYVPVTMEQLIANNRAFKEQEPDYFEIYGDRTGPMELEDGTWILPQKHARTGELYMEVGDMEYILAEYAWTKETGIMYHYEAAGKRMHDHSFREVLYAAFSNPNSFRICREDQNEYSEQELAYLEALVRKIQGDWERKKRK